MYFLPRRAVYRTLLARMQAQHGTPQFFVVLPHDLEDPARVVGVGILPVLVLLGTDEQSHLVEIGAALAEILGNPEEERAVGDEAVRVERDLLVPRARLEHVGAVPVGHVARWLDVHRLVRVAPQGVTEPDAAAGRALRRSQLGAVHAQEVLDRIDVADDRASGGLVGRDGRGCAGNEQTENDGERGQDGQNEPLHDSPRESVVAITTMMNGLVVLFLSYPIILTQNRQPRSSAQSQHYRISKIVNYSKLLTCMPCQSANCMIICHTHKDEIR